MLFNDEECQVLTMKDITNEQKLRSAQHKTKVMAHISSCISHELMTPIRCIITFAMLLVRELQDEALNQKASMIASTAKLLLSQIKMMLDNSLLANNHFEP
jgi:signal transduction histidine kinase